MIASDLANDGFVRKDEECPVCGKGDMWADSGESVCDTCFVVFNADTKKRTDPPTLNGDRPTYRSGYKKCPGGFLDPYEWGYDDNEFRY